ncbi:MAG: hypothetical protein WC521_08050 [Bdellovibrionales bacterium]|jgi:hypothetical protein
MKRKIILCALISLSALALAACGSLDGTVTSSAPPANEREVVPAINNPQTKIWRPGYWMPTGESGEFEWVPGEILQRPHPTAVWAPAFWVHHTYGWTFVAGHWE